MAHDHDHDQDINSYLLEQIFTIAIAGALGAVCVSMYVQDKLGLILHPRFFIWTLLGGITLLGLVVIRGIAVWQLAGKLRPAQALDHVHDHHDHHHEHVHELAHAPEHTHEHGEACCDHDHAHPHHEAVMAAPLPQTTSLAVIATPPALPSALAHDHNHNHDCCGHDPGGAGHTHGHDHDHGHGHDHGHSHGAGDGHDHGWAPWRYVLLLLPVLLFFLNLPNEGFSSTYNKPPDINELDMSGKVGNGGEAGRGGADFNVGFKGLERASWSESSRAAFAGKTVRLTGQFVGIDEKSFTLTRYILNCCAADAIALNAVILVDYTQTGEHKAPKLESARYRNKWVRVTGTVHFIKRRDSNDYVTALIVTPTGEKTKELVDLILPVQQPSNPYAND